jgi:hypothetical protein
LSHLNIHFQNLYIGNQFLYARLETGRIMWLGMASVHTGFRTITLVLYIRSLPNLTTWFPCGRGRTLFSLGSLGQRSRSLTINRIFDKSHFRMISLVLYIGYLPNLTTWLPCGRGRTLFILGSLPLYCLIIYIDGRILWCTQFLFIHIHNI